MADNDDVPGSAERDGVAPEPTTTHPVVPAETAETTPGPILKSRWRDRAWTFRAMLAVAAASLLIGGIVGGAIVAVAKHGHDDHGFHRMGPWGPGAGMPPGWQRHGPHKFKGPGGRGGPMMPYGNGNGNDDGTPPTPTPAPPSPSASG